jgi:hypothetical protein
VPTNPRAAPPAYHWDINAYFFRKPKTALVMLDLTRAWVATGDPSVALAKQICVPAEAYPLHFVRVNA